MIGDVNKMKLINNINAKHYNCSSLFLLVYFFIKLTLRLIVTIFLKIIRLLKSMNKYFQFTSRNYVNKNTYGIILYRPATE